MSSLQPSFVEESAESYVRRVSTDETPIMREARARCEEAGLPVIGPDTGAVLATLAGSRPGGRVLEVGCLHGYSALWLARGVGERGRVDTIEMMDAFADVAERNWQAAGLDQVVRVHRGVAADVLPKLEGPYDVVFIDADKENYPLYLDHALRLAKPGTVIAADNVFWNGDAWDDDAEEDEDLQGIRRFARRIHDEPRLLTAVLPVGDGLSVSVVR